MFSLPDLWVAVGTMTSSTESSLVTAPRVQEPHGSQVCGFRPSFKCNPCCPCVLSACEMNEWNCFGNFFFFSIIAYSYFSKKRVLSVHQILKGSAPHWLRTTDTSTFPLHAVPLCGSSGVRAVVTWGRRSLELLCRPSRSLAFPWWRSLVPPAQRLWARGRHRCAS